MSEEAIIQRTKAKGWNRLFSEAEEIILAGWVVYRRMHGKLVSGIIFSNFIQRNFGVSVEKSWISKFMARNHLSSLLVQKRSPKRARRSLPSEVDQFYTDLDAFNLEPNHIASIDVTSFWDWSPVLRTYGPKGS